VFSQFDTQVIQLPQSVKEVSDWMIKAIADLKGEIDTQALAWLTNQLALVKVMTWETLGIVSHSLKNMLDYASDRRITLDIAKSFLPELGEEDNISLLKTISKGDAKQIFSTYQQLTKTKTADEIVPLLANQIVSLLLVKELGNEALVAKQTGWQFGRVRAVMYEAKNYSKTQLENLLTQLLILDTQIKTSVGEKNVILTGWLTNLIRR
jgi:DNA polymerase III delta subunit